MTTGNIYKTETGREILLDFYSSMIGKWVFPYQSAYIPTRFGDTHTVTAGSKAGSALVLLHGSASNLLGWGAAIPAYMDRFHVIAPDIPGEPGRSSTARPSWDNDEYVRWLDDVLDGLGVERAALLGLSLGGWIAAKYAANRPEKVSRLVLLAPGGISPARVSTVLRTILYTMQGEKGAEKLKRLVFGMDAIPPEVGRFFDLLQLHFMPRFGSPKLLTDAEIKGIACPVLMMSGGEDAFFDTWKTVRRLRALLPGADIHIAPQGQHGIMDYCGGIAGFLKSI